MSVLRSHVVLMLIYAVATAAFFSLLWKRDRREQVRFFVLIFTLLFAGGLLLGWAMYPFPLR